MNKLKIDFLISAAQAEEQAEIALASPLPRANEENSETSLKIPDSTLVRIPYSPPTKQPIKGNSFYQQSIQRKVEHAMRTQNEGAKGFHPYQNSKDIEFGQYIASLRAQTYCSILSNPVKDDSTRNTFRCNFSSSCDKIIKGKGNLRRHVEWHLRRIEDEYKYKQSVKVEKQFPEQASPSAGQVRLEANSIPKMEPLPLESKLNLSPSQLFKAPLSGTVEKTPLSGK